MDDFRGKLKEEPSLFTRMFSIIGCKNDYALSIQASFFHESEPKETLKDVYKYKSWDLTIYKNNIWFKVDESDLPSWIKELFPENSYSNVGFVSTEIVQKIYEYLNQEE